MRKIRGSTDRLLDRLFGIIISYKKSHDGISPSIRYLTDELGIASTSHTNYLLDMLVEQGRITRIPGASRGIMTVRGSWTYPLSPEREVENESLQAGEHEEDSGD